MLKIKDLSHDYGNGNLFSPVNLELSSGESLLIRGENGIGKSTFLSIISNQLKPSQGMVFLETEIGFCGSDSRGLFPELTGRENIELFSYFSKKTYDITNWEKLESFSEALNTPFANCSSGMKMLLKLFISSLHKPELFILDETLSFLSPKNEHLFLEQWQSLLGAKTLIFTHHHKEDWTGQVLDLKGVENA